MKRLHSLDTLYRDALLMLLAVLMALPVLSFLSARAYAAEEEPDIKAEAAILIDADTGRVLWSKNGEERHYPASMTKMMTALLGISLLPPDPKSRFRRMRPIRRTRLCISPRAMFLRPKNFCAA